MTSSLPEGHGTETADFVVIGGGIAGVTCAETLSALGTVEKIVLITASPLIKAVTNLQQVSRALESFDVTQRPVESLQSDCPNVRVLQGSVQSLDSQNQTVLLDGQRTVTYKKLCICTGGKPKLICEDNPCVLGIRDTDSVQAFQQKLCCARRVLVVGNGGIATELVYELSGCEVVWAVKDDSISSLYLDPGAAQFLLPNLTSARHADTGPLKRHKYTLSDDVSPSGRSRTQGGALGPDWAERVSLKGATQTDSPRVHVEYGVQVRHVWADLEFKESGKMATKPGSTERDEITDWRVYVELTSGVIYGCDIVVSATGVRPNADPFLQGNQFEVADDGGLCVNDKMRTSVADVFAAGDVCTASWDIAPLWHQMRLWSQARQMGCYAAKCMLAELQGKDIYMDFCFELFAHVTKFFNYKVVLLGKYNGHNLGSDYSVIVRVTEGKEYVKTVMHAGRMVGATLIGETDLEETFENLILNQTDLTRFGEDLLDPGVDIEDYFD